MSKYVKITFYEDVHLIGKVFQVRAEDEKYYFCEYGDESLRIHKNYAEEIKEKKKEQLNLF